MKKLATILAFLIAPIAFSQSLGGGLFGPPSYPRFSTFANLSTPIAGHFRYCTDCTATAPCAGSGTGAFAFRVGSAWNCSNGSSGTGLTFLAGDGTAAAPAYSFASTGNGDNGMYLFAANAIGLSTAGTARWAVNASGALVAATDGGVDIGNGASDPRDVNITRHFATAGLAFASLGTPADGTFTYCTDCTQANPCAGSSSGSFARRENGAWNCGSGAGATYTALTAGSLTVTNTGSNGKPFVATWNNVHVNALGGVASGDIKVATLPAKTYVKNAYITITAQETVPTTLTVSLGRTAAGYIDYIVASDAKAAANTIYGNASGERGTNLTGYDYPSRTATTDVYIQFVATGDTMDNMLDTSGEVVIEYMVIP